MHNPYENQFLLHSFITERHAKLEKIAGNQILSGFVPNINVAKIRDDNRQTELAMLIRFAGDGGDHTQDRELHLDRCLDSGVQECTCMENLAHPRAVQAIIL